MDINENFSILVDSIKDYAIIMLDPEGIIISWNKGAKSINGYDPNEIIGKYISVFYPKKEVEQGEPQKNLEIAKKFGHFEKEGWRLRKDGSQFWADIIFTALYNKANNFIGFSKVSRDITEKKIAEDEIKKLNANLELKVKERTAEVIKSEIKYRKLIENNTDLIIMVDEKLAPIYRSPSSAKITGWTDKTRKNGENALNQTHPDDIERLNADLNTVQDNPGKPIHVNFRTKHQNGEYIWLEGVITNFLDDPQLNAIVINVKDITERKHSEELLQQNMQERLEVEEKLKSNEKLFRSIVLNIPRSLVVVMDRSERYVFVDGDIMEQFGYNKEDFEGKLARDIMPADRYEGSRQLMNRVYNGESISVERSTPDGDFIVHLVPLKNDAGYVYSSLMIVLEISEIKKAQKEIQELNQNLEVKVKERTLQLESVNKELEAFSYSVSHDLRAPLRAINGYSKMLGEDYGQLLNEEGLRLLKVISDNANKMGTLIDDLLAFSKLGRKELTKSFIDMNQLMTEVLSELQKTIKHKAVINKSNLHPVYGDYSLIFQVWINLLSNAIKYSSKTDSPKIEINSLENETEILFQVRDNGVGFDMVYAHKLFGVFQRLHSNAEFEGTGVGLAIVQRIINKHNGKVWAESTPDEGATFYFTMPKTENIN